MRGHGVSMLAVAAALGQLPTLFATKLALAYTAAIAVAYPYNAKLGYLNTLEPKYPMHYVPECLMAGLCGAGIMALMK